MAILKIYLAQTDILGLIWLIIDDYLVLFIRCQDLYEIHFLGKRYRNGNIKEKVTILHKTRRRQNA